MKVLYWISRQTRILYLAAFLVTLFEIARIGSTFTTGQWVGAIIILMGTGIYLAVWYYAYKTTLNIGSLGCILSMIALSIMCTIEDYAIYWRMAPLVMMVANIFFIYKRYPKTRADVLAQKRDV